MTLIVRIEGELPHIFVVGKKSDVFCFYAMSHDIAIPGSAGASKRSQHADLVNAHDLEKIICAGTCHIPHGEKDVLYFSGRIQGAVKYPSATAAQLKAIQDELLSAYQEEFPFVQQLRYGI